MSTLDSHAVVEWGLGVLRALWQVTWQGALWALAVCALTRALPRLPSSARAALWWLVGLKCLVVLCAPAAVRLPLLPAPEAPVAMVETVAPAPRGEAPRPVVGGGEALVPVPTPKPTGMRLGWSSLVLGVLLAWLAGLAWQGRELIRGLVQLRHIRREARPLEDATLQQEAVELGEELGLTRIPPLLVSENAVSPLALGLLRPEVILPRRALETLSPQEQRMALAHELAHVRRGDLWLGWVPTLAQAVFFFHPLVRRACREYALAREEACDAAALQATGAAPREYGRLLLLFGVARAPAAAAAPGASSHLAALKRRIAMLEHADTESKHPRRWSRWALGGLALMALVPFQVVARETAPPPPTPPSKAVQPAPPPAAPKPPPPPHDEDEDDKFSYVLLESSHTTSMSGSSIDLKVARALAKNEKLPLLYLRRDDGQEFLIRDAATLKTFEDTFKGVRALGEKQGELGEKMGELGGKQGEFGGKMGELGGKLGELGGKMGELGQKQAKLNLKHNLLEMEADEGAESPEKKREREQLERELKEIERQQEELEKQMEPINAQMEALGREMEKFNEPMEALGKQMEALGEQMEAHSHEAEKKARALFEDAIRRGVAEPVKR
ncbi:M56 family metallopeptidase [Archangium sp.]|uniref:M56 family metallopeptidase n=1 Tax=Archangium sp. TaxID=1872627 RepID=UPI00286C8907|nr:M56 family metallopeptidase [Archangium sp.]